MTWLSRAARSAARDWRCNLIRIWYTAMLLLWCVVAYHAITEQYNGCRSIPLKWHEGKCQVKLPLITKANPQ